MNAKGGTGNLKNQSSGQILECCLQKHTNITVQNEDNPPIPGWLM